MEEAVREGLAGKLSPEVRLDLDEALGAVRDLVHWELGL